MDRDTVAVNVELVGRTDGVLRQVLVELAAGTCSNKDDI
jgi:hypothetical protein